MPNITKISANLFEKFSDQVGYHLTSKPTALRCPRYSGEDLDRVEQHKQELQDLLGVGHFIIPDQTHSDICVEITQSNKSKTIEADAVFTKERDIALCVLASDCVPILFYDPITQITGAIHAGWKGLENRIISKVFSEVSEKYSIDYSNIQVFVGPHICQDCYEVGEEVSEVFQEKYSSCVKASTTQEKKYLLDTGAIAVRQLQELGIESSNIEYSEYCTYEEKELFHSYRRKTHTGDKNYGNNGFAIRLK